MSRPIDRRQFLRRAGMAATACALPRRAAGADKADGPLRIYIAVDDHTDYLWSADAETYQKAFVETLDYYLDQADKTADDPPEYQGRFCCDGSLWLWAYERRRSPAQFRRLIARIKDGHINVPLTPLVLCVGGAPAEAVLRSMYYAGHVERKHGLRLPLARVVENQTLPFGLGSLLAGAGAKYCWHGICSCATRVPNGARLPRQHEVYWWRGRDGRRVLMKWYSMWGGNAGLGGYAEARSPGAAIDFVTTSGAFRQRHPWRVIGIFGKGWDDLKTLTDEFPRVAKAKTDARREVIVSNEIDFFRDMERTYGKELPAFSASFGNEWDVLTASLAEPTASIKRSAEKLRAAEAMATCVTQKRPGFPAGRDDARRTAWMNFGLYYEHDWTADGRISRKDRAAWSRGLARQVAKHVDALHAGAAAALAGMIPSPAGKRRFYAFNPLSWRRTDAVDLPLDARRPMHVVDLAGGKEVPSQVVRAGGKMHLRVLAADLPPVGYKVFEVRDGAGRLAGGGPVAAAGQIENRFYRLAVSGRGAVTSLVDKARGGRQLVRTIRRLAVNDLGGGTGRVQVESAGPVSATLKVTADGPVRRTTRVTLLRDCPRIDIRNEITQNFSEVLTWAFSFDLAEPDVWHEEVGAIIRARLLGDGGHYSPINARYDWLTLNHFLDVTGRGGGVTLSSADCCFFRLGESSTVRLDTATPQVRVLAGGQVDGRRLGIQGQDGEEHFLHRFALRAHGAYDEPAAMRFAMEHQNPPVARWLTGGGEGLPADEFSYVTIDRPDVLLWALKPADDDPRRTVARLWNLGARRTAFALRRAGGPLSAAREVTHVETPIGPARVRDGALAESIGAHEMRTYDF